MEKIIPPVDKQLLITELTKDKFVRKTNNGNNLIYIFDYKDSPNLMREVGRLREITFRDAGGGTGKEIDIDEFDLGEKPFRQLIVWNPEEYDIVGGYRFAPGSEFEESPERSHLSPTAELFHYSEKFIDEFLPLSIELGRSFVQPNFQPQINLRKGMYSLDNLWDGLGAIVIDYPGVKYLFGKVTMYPHYDYLARDLVLYFMEKFFPDPDHLLTPIEVLPLRHGRDYLDSIFTGATYEDNLKILVQRVRAQNENVPPLVNAYMSLSATMRTFGTSLNRSFGDVEETGILVTISDIYDFKKDRHISTYKKE
jgi:hypothetical protein